MYKGYRPSKEIDAMWANWARWSLVDGDSPFPKPPGISEWAKQYKPRYREHGGADESTTLIDYKEARQVQAVYKSLPKMVRFVIRAEYVGSVYYGKPRSRHETVRLLNILVRHNKIDTPNQRMFNLQQYECDLQYACRRLMDKMERRHVVC